MCASKSVYLYKSPYSLKVYRFACAHSYPKSRDAIPYKNSELNRRNGCVKKEVRGDVGRTVYRCRVLTSVYHFCPLIYALRKPKFSSFFTLILVNNPKNEMAVGCIHSI